MYLPKALAEALRTSSGPLARRMRPGGGLFGRGQQLENIREPMLKIKNVDLIM